jgi:hypothetical protein
MNLISNLDERVYCKRYEYVTQVTSRCKQFGKEFKVTNFIINQVRISTGRPQQQVG